VKGRRRRWLQPEMLVAAMATLALTGIPATASLAQEPSPEFAVVMAATADEPLEQDHLGGADAVGGLAEGAASVEPSQPRQWLQTYRTWAERDVTPVLELLVPVIVVIAALLLIARMLTPLTNPWPRIDGWARVLVLVGGIVLIVATAVLGVLVLPRADLYAWPALGALGLAGTVTTAWAVGKRLRLTVEATNATGQKDPAGTAHVVALLNELGAEPPRGLEVPRASDLQALHGVLKLLPEGTIGKALTSAVEWLFGLSPWKAVVEKESEDLLSVEISRNGHGAGSAVIDRDQLGLRVPLARPSGTPPAGEDEAAKPQAPPDLHRLAAAVVLTTLATKHRGFDGLTGATDWRSVGLHYVATTDLQDAPEARQLLARAAEFDPDNLSAQVAWRHALDREATKAEDLAAYIDWLDDMIEKMTDADGDLKPGHAALRQRVRYSRTAATINLHYAKSSPGSGTRPRDPQKDREAFELLMKELADDAVTEGLSRFRRAARPGAAAMASWANEHLPGDQRIDDEDIGPWLNEPTGPKGHYNLGCFHATRNEPDHRIAIAHLRYAADVPRLRAWMSRDPQLEAFTHETIYRETFNRRPSEDLLALPTLEPFADALKGAGATDFRSLRRYLAAPEALRHVVGPDRTIVGQVRETLRLAASVPEELADFRVELCRELLERDALDRFDEFPQDELATLAGAMTKAIATRCDSAPKGEAVETWLQDLATPDRRHRPRSPSHAPAHRSPG
jgi:hypothetical protein